MPDDLLELVEKEVLQNSSPEKIKDKLTDEGYLEADIESAINEITKKHGDKRKSETDKLVKTFSIKEIFDRIGYGFVPHQFINILFYLTGANFFWLGVVNGAKSILSILVSSIFQELSKVKELGKSFISWSGYLFGFSFFGMALGTLIQSPLLFAISLFIGGAGVVTHGDLYRNFVQRHLKKEKMSKFLAKIGNYGLLITAVCMVISGWLMEEFPWTGGETVTLFGNTYPMMGYLISFEITAIMFILSGYMISRIKKNTETQEKVKGFAKDYWNKIKVYLKTFLTNKHLFLLIAASILLGFTQILGNSYFGLFIYQEFTNIAFGGFLNVGIIFAIAVVASLVAPTFSRWFNEHTGLAPTLVFGTLLSALMPLALAYNPNLVAIGIANALSVIGASILGVSQGMLARKLLHDDEREVYFNISSLAGVIPFAIMIPLGSYYAQLQGLTALFKVLAFLLIIVVAPLYIALVWMGRKNRL